MPAFTGIDGRWDAGQACEIHPLAGEFIEEAPNANGGDTDDGDTQMVLDL